MLATTAIGMNLDVIADYSPAWFFNDIFLSSRSWISHAYNTATGAASWDGGGTVHVDEHGWPTELNEFTDGSGQRIQQRLGTLMFDAVDGHYPAGIYEVRWQGTGTLAWQRDAAVIEQGTLPDGAHFARLNVTPTGQGIYLRIDTMSSADPIRDIHVWMPDYNGQSFAGQVWRPGAGFSPFHPLFRERLDPFDTIRFVQTAKIIPSDVVHWSGRREVDDARQCSYAGEFQEGIALEYMLELVNELDANAWLNMPYLADDEFVRNYATMVRDTLEPGLNVYLEWSNEPWNWANGFETNPWLVAQASLPENAGLSVYQIWAREAKRDFDIWSEVFAGQSDRIVRVVAGQAANSWITGQVLANLQGAFDAVSCDAYVTFNLAQETQFDADTTAEEAIDAMFAEALPDTLTFLANHQALADQYSALLGRPIQLVAYEGGPLLYGHGDPYESAFEAAVRSPRMYDLYEDLLRGANAIGMDLFTAFSYTDTSPYGDAEHLDYQDQPLADAHRYRALMDAVSGTLLMPDVSVEATVATGEEHGQDAVSLRIRRTGDAEPALEIAYQFEGTATAADFASLPATFTLAANETERIVTLTPLDDSLREGDEMLTLTLLPGEGYRVDAAHAIVNVTLADGDDRVYADMPLVNPSFETGNFSGWTLEPASGNFSTVLTAVSDPSAPGAAHQGQYYVWGAGPMGTSGNGALTAGVSQRVDVADLAAALDTGGATFTLAGWGGGNGTGAQDAFLQVRFFDASAGGNLLGSPAVSPSATAAAAWSSLAVTVAVPVGTRSIEVAAMTRRPTGWYANRAGFDDLAAELVYLAPDVNAPPVDIRLSPSSVAENSPAGTTVGGLATIDPDDTEHSLELLDDADGRFALDGGRLVVANGSLLDFEQQSLHTVIVRSTDPDGESIEKALAVTITDVDEVRATRFAYDAGLSSADDDRQRSTITRIQVVFNGVVSGLGTGAFVLLREGSAIPINLRMRVVEIVGATTSVVTLQFASGPGVYRRGTGHALVDGNYRLSVNAAKIRAAGARPVLDGHDDFFRLFGDSDGDRDVDSRDLSAIRQAMTGPNRYAGLREAFDYDGDRDVDGADYREFRLRYGRRLPGS